MNLGVLAAVLCLLGALACVVFFICERSYGGGRGGLPHDKCVPYSLACSGLSLAATVVMIAGVLKNILKN